MKFPNFFFTWDTIFKLRGIIDKEYLSITVGGFRTNAFTIEDHDKSGTPPPLPPKRRTRAQQLLDESDGILTSSLDRVSLRSRSPEDSSSLLSASAGSLDSALNHSRDEDEIRAIMGPNDESLNDSMDLSLIATIHGNFQNPKKTGQCV